MASQVVLEVKNPSVYAVDARDSDPWIGKRPWSRKWYPTQIFLPGKYHGYRSLAGYSPCGCKELDKTEQTHI